MRLKEMHPASLAKLLVTLIIAAVAGVIAGPEASKAFALKAVNFIFILSVIVFIHEFGHYIIAKWAGVKIETFSIGFGREIAGWNDRSGTRWKLSLLPFGGYVKMYGDASEASNPSEAILNLPEEEKQKTFHYKPLYKKAAIVAAGPLANFLLTIVIFTAFIFTNGITSTEPQVGSVQPDSPAALAGLHAGDRVLKIGHDTIDTFSDISASIITNLGTPVDLLVQHPDGNTQTYTITPKMVTEKDALGNDITRPILGIVSTTLTLKTVGPVQAVWEASKLTYSFCKASLKGIGQIILGERSAKKNITGPIGMAQMSGKAMEKGMHATLYFIAILSANLGLINLFPIPVLDGGHLLFYLVQAVTRRPINAKLQELSFRIGMALISMLMAFAFFNDFGLFGK